MVHREKASLTLVGQLDGRNQQTSIIALLSDLALITVAAPARTIHLSVFVPQLQGPFNFIVRAGLSPLAACSLNRRMRLTRPLQRLSNIGLIIC